MVTIALNALFTTLSRRGTTRQLASAIVICVICALLVLPAIVWYNVRFSTAQPPLSVAEIETVLVYVVLFGWIMPISTTCSYCLFSLPRLSMTAGHIPSHSIRLKKAHPQLPGHQPGVLAPFVYNEDMPWGWLEYRNGRFQGQRLELKRVVVTIGRGEDNDIWLDDDMASRHHAELVWDKGQVYITDCDSLNGIVVKGRRMRGSVQIETNELLQIGSHRFVFILSTEKGDTLSSQNDPLTKHVWHSSLDSLSDDDDLLPATNSVQEEEISSSSNTEICGVITIQDGEMKGQSFLLDRPVTIVGRGVECDIVIDDSSISRRHVQFLRQNNENYVQDISSSNGTKANNEPLFSPHLLTIGDVICIGNIHMKYELIQAVHTAPLALILKMNGPMPLRLPSKPKT
ncbi:MAG: FHA domain-containing protein [Chloroflexi bacterium]|nr:FHA domain-containing protein [Ktedonobacteraceae bacterium]MBV9708506.1 FHA domain-containing protein [Chloroflexota bacterium]